MYRTPYPVGYQMIEQTLGNSLRFLREQQGISLRALAERTDFSASFLSQMRMGGVPFDLFDEEIANALGVTLGSFSSPPISKWSILCAPAIDHGARFVAC